ncbi:MAG: Gfo/Idh/MocA family oxidoreductase [Anaerolineae bacterium]|nr:Gfo/Idh/MocA family oxidoreductase [Anaerolineae bacterium]
MNHLSVKPLRAGVVGMGIGRHHARAYQDLKDTELVAICDVNADRLEQIGALFPNVARYSDYHALFAEAGLDLVSVAVPNILHAEITIAALEAGLHVVCEKPLAVDVAAAEAIVQAAERARGKLTVCYDKRYRADAQWLRRAVASSTLGDIYHVEAGWKRETGIPGGWFVQKAMSGGGPLIDLGVHVLDIALWVLGFPAVKTVSGVTRAVFGPAGRKTWGTKTGDGSRYEVEDGAVGMLRLEGNVPMLLEASWADHRRPGEDDMYFRFSGSKAAAVVHVRNYTQEDTLRLYTEIDGIAVEATPRLHPPDPSGHAGLLADFVRAIRMDDAPPAPASQGLATVRVLDAFYRSAATGREVALE